VNGAIKSLLTSPFSPEHDTEVEDVLGDVGEVISASGRDLQVLHRTGTDADGEVPFMPPTLLQRMVTRRRRQTSAFSHVRIPSVSLR